MSKIVRRRFAIGTLPRRPAQAMLGLTAAAFLLLLLPLVAEDQKASPPEFHLTAVGDAIIVTPAMVRQSDAGFMGVINAVRKGDAAVMNFEGTFAGRESFPIADSTATWIAADPERLKELQWMGFNLFSSANNHSADFGVRGVLDTLRVFRQGGAVYAGIGENLGEARAPGYLTTPHGRVALISCASTFSPEAPAGQARPDMRGRPGLSPLHHQTRYLVEPSALEALRKMKQDLQIAGDQSLAGQPALRLNFDGVPVTFESSQKPGVVTNADPHDLAELIHSIREAREMANYVVVYIHSHEQAPSSLEAPADFLVQFAHMAVDAGADVFAASGPHVLRGIEVYHGKLILYSLGNFIFENDLVIPQPTEVYQLFGLGPDALPSEYFNARSDHDRKNWPAEPRDWESVVADVVFRGGRPEEVKLTPIALGYGEKRPDRGYPRLADASQATRILERLQNLSKAFGTNIVIRNGVGTITIAK
jgi:poly-gamma-glutamate capsule biosynthesis protein CapA/YwtB (metallophosphatase superfamily)